MFFISSCIVSDLCSMPRKVIHRDLKMENVLLDVADISRAVPKIADFGLSALVPNNGFRSGIPPTQIERAMVQRLTAAGVAHMQNHQQGTTAAE